jgi:hypothetical protein
LPQQPFDSLEPLVTFDRKMERLAGESVVARVQEGDRGSRLTKVTPDGPYDVCLPP